MEYRIPIVNQVTFAFFTDFGLTFDAQPAQLRQSVPGQSPINSPLVWLPDLRQRRVLRRQAGTVPAVLLKTVPGTNFVPRMSNGAELQVILPIVNAPFRIYYAYNPLRLYKDLPQQLAVPLTARGGPTCFRDFFPNSGAGQFSYQQALQFYGANYMLREPRKTFRLTVSTTF